MNRAEITTPEALSDESVVELSLRPQRLSEFIALAQLCSGVGWNIVHLTDFELMTLVELLEAAQRDAIKARRVIDR